MKRRYMSAEESEMVKDHIRKWSTSGVSQADYCRNNNIALSTFGRYKYSMKKNGELNAVANGIKNNSTPIPKGFIAVNSNNDSTIVYDVVVGKATIKVHAANLKAVLEVLHD
jgi:hypothetical protein